MEKLEKEFELIYKKKPLSDYEFKRILSKKLAKVKLFLLKC